jgi:hypothetical protein
VRRDGGCGDGSVGRLSRASAAVQLVSGIILIEIGIPLLKSLNMSRGVSLCTLPLLLRLSPGVLAAFARSRNARIACGVVGAILRDGIGLVEGPPRGVLAVPGVRISDVLLLPGEGLALAARRKGVLGCRRAIGVVCVVRSGDTRCLFRAESDMLWESSRCRPRSGCVDAPQGNASVGRASLWPRLS